MTLFALDRSRPRRRLGLLAVGATLVLGACAKRAEEERAVRGAEALASSSASDASVYEVLQHPLTASELGYFLESSDAVLAAGEAHPGFWGAVSDAENPMQAMRHQGVWRAAGVDYEDFVAAFIKINFLYEHLEEPISSKQAWENVERLRKASAERGDAEAAAAVFRMRQIAAALEGMEAAGSIELYQNNWPEVERALDRFKAMGDQ